LNSVEPVDAKAVRSLLAKDKLRAALADEIEPCGPEVPFVVGSRSLARSRERLAWAGSSPDRKVVWNPGKAQGVGPSSDAGEEVGLLEALEVFRRKVDHAPLVHGAGRDVAARDQVAQPRCGVRLKLVVERAAHSGTDRLALRRAATTDGAKASPTTRPITR
jgi:hypothetical protein